VRAGSALHPDRDQSKDTSKFLRLFDISGSQGISDGIKPEGVLQGQIGSPLSVRVGQLDLNLGGLTETIDRYLGKRPVYVMRLDRREVALLAERYDLDYIDGVDASSLTRVIGLKAAAS